MKDTYVITKSGYVGENIKPVNPINGTIKTKSATEQPVYKRFNLDEKEELTEEERTALADQIKERKDANIKDIYDSMISWPNKVREDLLEQNKSRK